MDLYEAIYSRRTVRDFQAKGIETAIMNKILAAGLLAPSNNHMRQWEFIIVNDPSVRLSLMAKIPKTISKQKVAEILDSWGANDPIQREMYFDGIPKQYSMILNARCLIIPCFKQASPLLKPGSLSSLNGFASIWCCIENILLAAAAEGIYGVTRIPFAAETKNLKKVLQIPDEYEIPCYIALGYPADDGKPIRQISIQVEDRMHFNSW